MFKRPFDLARTSILAMSLCAGIALPSAAQETSPGLSSGSGQGTGSGLSTGVQRNRTGSMSGAGPRAPGAGGPVTPIPPVPGGTFRGGAGFTQGVNVQFPNDPLLVPYLKLEEEQFGGPVDGMAPNRVGADILKRARLIESPEERSLALQRIAKGAIESMQLTLAHQTLEEAAKTVDAVTDPLVHDQRLIAIVTSLNTLTPVVLRVALEERPRRDSDLGGPDAAPKRMDTEMIFRVARLEWKRAAHLAANIANPTYRNEMLYRVAENEAAGSKSIADAFAKPSEAPISFGNNPAVPQGEDPRNDKFRKLADEVLVEAFDIAKKIDRLVWRFRAEVQVALQAANSQQFTRGVELALQIDNAKSRAEALLLLADPMCRRERSVNLKLETPLPRDDRGNVTFRFPTGLMNRIEFRGGGDPDWTRSGDPRKLVLKGYISKAELAQLNALLNDRVYHRALGELYRLYNADQDSATPVFQEAAKATASIQAGGLRGVVNGLLVDGLTSAGRFDDARACTAIYAEESERFVALGDIAYAQARRGGAESARRWIAQEAPEEYRSAFYRRVTDGELWVIDESQGRQIPRAAGE
ncbi:MAG: hypothetical protein ACLQIB_17220 [Isosphaeraceae bacterium]